jgi:phospholipid/cholesterol/gamma-HCH transport system substrate-binding protein
VEREANYAAVGAFVLLVLLLGGFFVYWYTGAAERRSFDRYEIYFEGSVSGLDRGAPVRYLGVGVGRVINMRIDPRDPSRVEVIVDIDSTTPISDKTLAVLSLQGVTGLLYVDLLQSHGERKASPPVESLKYPVIRSTPSQFDVFLAGLPQLVVAARDVIDRAGRLLGDPNLKAVTSSLQSLEKATAGLPRTLQDLSTLISDLRGATSELTASARSTRATVESVGPEALATVQRIHAVADSLESAAQQLDALLADNRSDVRTFTREGLPEVERFVREGRAAIEEIRALSSSLRENPSRLLYQQAQRGVEIPR